MNNSQNKSLSIVMHLVRLNALITRRFGVQGLGIGDFMVLYYLNEAADGKLRRVDLAEKLGVTASGITRMLLPMEKIGLVKKEVSKEDARVTFAVIAPGGKRMLGESIERAEMLSEEILYSNNAQKLQEIF
ncbi:MAG: MarR family transcriptional regulator [Candidatus Doudnabacteria bacterium]|nr:MarR family transcriptional regulator [Candidatus Doudnabacteria bacterium]